MKKIVWIVIAILALLILWGEVSPAGSSKPHGLGPPAVSLTSATSLTCPPGFTCIPGEIITDGAKGMGAAFLVEDNEGHLPGHNAAMFWVDGFQAGSINPVCSNAEKPYALRVACLGGPPFSATGGHPVLSLWDGREWQVLTATDIIRAHRRGI